MGSRQVSPLVQSEASAWGQAEFQGGRDVRALIWPPSRWVIDMGSP
jgi:hypothetical protein